MILACAVRSSTHTNCIRRLRSGASGGEGAARGETIGDMDTFFSQAVSKQISQSSRQQGDNIGSRNALAWGKEVADAQLIDDGQGGNIGHQIIRELGAAIGRG